MAARPWPRSRRTESLRRIPVVVLTTSKDEEDVLRTYDLGVNSFITKPVTFAGLVEAMRTWTRYWFEVVELPERRRSMAAQAVGRQRPPGRGRRGRLPHHPGDARGARTGSGSRSTGAPTTTAGSAAIREQRHDVYLIDYRLGARTGLDLVREAFASAAACPGDHAHRAEPTTRSISRRRRSASPTSSSSRS